MKTGLTDFNLQGRQQFVPLWLDPPWNGRGTKGYNLLLPVYGTLDRVGEKRAVASEAVEDRESGKNLVGSHGKRREKDSLSRALLGKGLSKGGVDRVEMTLPHLSKTMATGIPAKARRDARRRSGTSETWGRRVHALP